MPQKIKDYYHAISCALCHSNRYTIMYKGSVNLETPAEEVLKQFRCRGGDVLLDQVVQCLECGLIYINPRLLDAYLLQEYIEGAIQGYKEQFVSQNEGRKIAFSRSIRMLNRLCPGRGRLLDVGAADGTFMAIARDYGWDVSGCEPNRWFCAWGQEAHGIHIDQGTLLEQHYPEGSFDVITLWDVIEHVSDPRILLDRCCILLKSRGLLVLTYPDIGSWIARLMGRNWVFLMSVHLYYFTIKTITAILQSCGFEILKSFPHFQTLQLEYIIYRMQTHSVVMARVCKWFADLLHLNRLMLPYWVGINCVIAKKTT